jgi:hypothetical protein
MDTVTEFLLGAGGLVLVSLVLVGLGASVCALGVIAGYAATRSAVMSFRIGLRSYRC